MQQVIIDHETWIRLTAFTLFFLLVAGWELLQPRRTLKVSKGLRWVNNLGVTALNTLLVRLLIPAGAVGAAGFAEAHQLGLLNLTPKAPFWLDILAAVIILDLIIYGQHVLVHKVQWLWRLHRVHHADLDFDVTTGARFHPVEILFSMVVKISAVVIFGAPIISVILFEVILNGMAMFNHGNVRLPSVLDKVLRRFLVTPDMHRIHHSINPSEANSNFGFNLSLWDRLFGTYKANASHDQTLMTIGTPGFRSKTSTVMLSEMLCQPFSKSNNE